MCPNRQLTLIELLLVLTLLAIVSTMALGGIVEQQNQVRYEQTLSTLKQLETAVVGRDWSASGSEIEESLKNRDYISTMGAPPDQLQQLWINPTLNVFGKKIATDGSNVALYCGWRGPYIRLGIGQNTLLDGWGRPFQLLDQEGNEINPLGSAPIEIIQSFAADLTAGGNEGYNADLVAIFAANSNAVNNLESVTTVQDFYRATIDVYLRYEDLGVAPGVITDPDSSHGNIIIRYYHPNPITGDITFSDLEITTPFAPGENFRRSISATIGSRAIRALQGTGTIFSVVQTLQLVPGTQSNELTLLLQKP